MMNTIDPPVTIQFAACLQTFTGSLIRTCEFRCFKKFKSNVGEDTPYF
jgi:hypothetical protein